MLCEFYLEKKSINKNIAITIQKFRFSVQKKRNKSIREITDCENIFATPKTEWGVNSRKYERKPRKRQEKGQENK